MKFYETHFEEYVSSVKRMNLHQNLNRYWKYFPESIENLGNLIFYGPSGVGKYSQMLYSIKKYYKNALILTSIYLHFYYIVERVNC